jgi:hypothetical protein
LALAIGSIFSACFFRLNEHTLVEVNRLQEPDSWAKRSFMMVANKKQHIH